MNVDRMASLVPACGDRWLPPLVSEAFTVEQPVPAELARILETLGEDPPVRVSGARETEQSPEITA